MNKNIYRYLRPVYYDKSRNEIETEKNGGISFKVIDYTLQENGFYAVTAAITLCHFDIPFNKKVTIDRLNLCEADNLTYYFPAKGLDIDSLSIGFVQAADSNKVFSENLYLQKSVSYYADIIEKLITTHVTARNQMRVDFSSISGMGIQNEYID